MKIHHIGYLVKKIDKAKEAFLELGYTVRQETVADDYRQVQICFLEKDGYVVELVSPLSGESVVAGLIKKFGNSPYHICYETDTYEKELEELQEKRYRICSESHEAIAIGGRNVCFLIHPHLGMIELVEGENESQKT